MDSTLDGYEYPRKVRIHLRNKGMKQNILGNIAGTYLEQLFSNIGQQKMANNGLPFFSCCGTCQIMPQGDVGYQPHSS